MDKIRFQKYSGAGNDFIFIDNRNDLFAGVDLPEFVRKACGRQMSVGADGFVLIENCESADFKWRFYNSDGSLAEMCGNAARCAAQFAYTHGLAEKKMSFLTDAGLISAEITDQGAKVGTTPPKDERMNYTITPLGVTTQAHSLNTGVPHVVIQVDDIENTKVLEQGRAVRYLEDYSPAGTNVNFVEYKDPSSITVRTYERGVEDETLACGTGCIASAIVMSKLTDVKSPVSVHTRGGIILTIYFKNDGNKIFDVFLEGEARLIYTAELEPGALAWNPI